MSSSNQKSQLHALGFLILAMLSVQSSASLAKILFQNFPVLTVSAMRLCLGAIILAFLEFGELILVRFDGKQF